MSVSSISRTRKLAICGVCVALAFMLNQVSLFRMPQGGSITPASMLFIVLAGYWLGPVYGILAGVAKGLLDTATGVYVVHPIQYLLDYPMAFGMLGFAGLFRKWKFGLQIGYVVGVTGRLLMVFTSGLVFFADVLNVGLVAGASFSFVYNIAYIGPEMVVTLIIISLPAMQHAIDAVTKSVVPYEEYVIMTSRQGKISPAARLVTGAVIGAFGGLAFVLVSHIQRLESLSIMQYTTGAYLFAEAPSRITRMIERNTGHIAGLQTVGVLFLALALGLVFSIFLRAQDEKTDESVARFETD